MPVGAQTRRVRLANHMKEIMDNISTEPVNRGLSRVSLRFEFSTGLRR